MRDKKKYTEKHDQKYMYRRTKKKGEKNNEPVEMKKQCC